MAARAIWKGVLRLPGEKVPVKLYSAVQDRAVHFRLLHEPDRVPLEQRMLNPRTGESVPHGEIRRGYEAEEGRFVLVEEEELDAIEPEASRDIEILRFVPLGAIDHRWYLRPYWLGPDGDEEAYLALASALEEAEREGIARWTMRKKDYRGALRVRDGFLALVALRSAGEIVSAADLGAPTGRKMESQELEMAERLVDALAGDFDPTAFENEYRERVLELIETKARGGVVEFPEPAAERAAGSLASRLEESLERIEAERVA